MHPRITEVLANPPGTDKGAEWVELCADARVALAEYALKVGSRTLPLSGELDAESCAVARTGTAAIRNREADVSLLYKGELVRSVRTAGTAPEGSGFHVGPASFWATSTPGIASGTLPALPPLLALPHQYVLPGALGTAACTAGILTAIALAALRHARDSHHALPGRDAADSR